MSTYILDALRYREGTFGAVWLSLGATNLSLLVSGASFSRSRPIFLAALMAVSTGSLLFLIGEVSPPDQLSDHLHLRPVWPAQT